MSEVYNILIFLFIGSGFLFAASKVIEKKKRLINNGLEADGIIFGFEASSNTYGQTMYPIVRFVTKEGLWITETADYAPPQFFLKKGQAVKIIYNPDNPKEFIYKTSIDYSKISYFIMGIGIVCLGAGVWFAYKYLTK